MVNLASQMVKKLADVADLERMLEERKMSPLTALRLLRSPQGRAQVAARKKLARIHSEIVAARYTPYAMKKLCAMLEEKDRPDLRLNGALKILEAAGLIGKKTVRAKAAGKPAEEDIELSADDLKQVLRLLARKK